MEPGSRASAALHSEDGYVHPGMLRFQRQDSGRPWFSDMEIEHPGVSHNSWMEPMAPW